MIEKITEWVVAHEEFLYVVVGLVMYAVKGVKTSRKIGRQENVVEGLTSAIEEVEATPGMSKKKGTVKNKVKVTLGDSKELALAIAKVSRSDRVSKHRKSLAGRGVKFLIRTLLPWG